MRQHIARLILFSLVGGVALAQNQPTWPQSFPDSPIARSSASRTLLPQCGWPSIQTQDRSVGFLVSDFWIDMPMGRFSIMQARSAIPSTQYPTAQA